MKPETKAKLKAFQETMLDSDDDFSEGLEPLESTDKMKMILNEPKVCNRYSMSDFITLLTTELYRKQILNQLLHSLP